jgi:hypothetical protein
VKGRTARGRRLMVILAAVDRDEEIWECRTAMNDPT